MLLKWLSSMLSYVYVPETGVAPTSVGFQGPNLPSERMTPGGSVLLRVARYNIGAPDPTFVKIDRLGITNGGSVLLRVARYNIGAPDPTFVIPRRSIFRTYS